MSISKTFFALLIVSSFAVSFAVGQRKKPRTKPAASATNATETRARRTEPVTTPETATPQPTKEATTTPATAQPSPVTATPESSRASSNQANEKAPVKQAEGTPTETAPVVKDPIKALRDQIDAAATDQDKIRLQLELADQLLATGKKSEALAELQAITSMNVFDPQAFYNTGNAFARLGETSMAVVAYRKAIEQRKGRYSRASNNLGVVLLRAGRWDEAQDAFLSALRVENFRYAEASYNLGRLYAARGETDLAIREWRRALAVNPEHAAAKQSIARAGNEEIIVERPATEIARDTNAPTPAAAPKRTVEKEPVASSSRIPAPVNKTAPRNSKSLALDPTSFSFLLKARSASERGNQIEAIENYQRLINRQHGYFGPANLELGYVLISLKRNDEAMATLLSVANREGARYPISYYHLARIYEGRGELKLAEDSFMRAVAGYHNQNAQFFLDLSRVREKQGDFKGALEAMEQFVSLAKREGHDLIWSEERLTSLRQKATVTTPK